MAEHPLILTDEESRAVREGRKTRHSVPLKHQPPSHIDALYGNDFRNRAPHTILNDGNRVVGFGFEDDNGRVWQCPQIGDVMWVKEAWGDRAWYATIGAFANQRAYYRADGKKGGWVYRPARTMPRWAARTLLTLTNVRIQRVQEVTEAECVAEGCNGGYLWAGSAECDEKGDLVINQFNSLWDSKHGKKPGLSWADNPWILVTEWSVNDG